MLSGLVRLTIVTPDGEKGPAPWEVSAGVKACALWEVPLANCYLKLSQLKSQFDINMDKLPLKHGALGERSVGAPT